MAMASARPAVPESGTRPVSSEASAVAELDHAVAALQAADAFGFDLETTGYDCQRDAIKGTSLSVGPGDDLNQVSLANLQH